MDPLSIFEEEIGSRLPQDYREFLLSFDETLPLKHFFTATRADCKEPSFKALFVCTTR